MPSSKLIKKCIASIVGTVLAVSLPECTSKSPVYFRTNDIPSIKIPVGECIIYSGSELCYRGMDSARGVFYVNGAQNAIPVSTDTLKHQLGRWNNNINLFVIESATPESLTVRNVGFNAYP